MPQRTGSRKEERERKRERERETKRKIIFLQHSLFKSSTANRANILSPKNERRRIKRIIGKKEEKEEEEEEEIANVASDISTDTTE